MIAIVNNHGRWNNQLKKKQEVENNRGIANLGVLDKGGETRRRVTEAGGVPVARSNLGMRRGLCLLEQRSAHSLRTQCFKQNQSHGKCVSEATGKLSRFSLSLACCHSRHPHPVLRPHGDCGMDSEKKPETAPGKFVHSLLKWQS